MNTQRKYVYEVRSGTGGLWGTKDTFHDAKALADKLNAVESLEHRRPFTVTYRHEREECAN